MNNLAAGTQFVALLAQVEDQVVTASGTVAESRTRRSSFTELMAERSGAGYDATLTDVVLPLVPGLTGGLQQGIRVGGRRCGSGRRAFDLMAELSRARGFAGSRSLRRRDRRGPRGGERKGLASGFGRRDAGSARRGQWVRLRRGRSMRCTTRPGRTCC